MCVRGSYRQKQSCVGYPPSRCLSKALMPWMGNPWREWLPNDLYRWIGWNGCSVNYIDKYHYTILHLWSSSDDVLYEDDSDNGYDDDWNVVDCRSKNPSQAYHFWIIFWNSNLFVDLCCRIIMHRSSFNKRFTFWLSSTRNLNTFRLAVFFSMFFWIEGILAGESSESYSR